jgi:hypothetical protein
MGRVGVGRSAVPCKPVPGKIEHERVTARFFEELGRLPAAVQAVADTTGGNERSALRES